MVHPARKKMEATLKSLVIPKLRDIGFKGSFPHFRRQAESHVELLTFQFNLSGGSFVIESSVCTPKALEQHWNSALTLKTVTAHDIGNRYRLGASAKGSDHWFVFGKRNDEPGHEILQADAHFSSLANDVNSLIDSQAEAIWLSLL